MTCSGRMRGGWGVENGAGRMSGREDTCILEHDVTCVLVRVLAKV